jgi:hypothetical protein
MCALLCDADLFASGATTYNYALCLTHLYCAERQFEPGPPALLKFIDTVMHGTFITDAARAFQPNLDAIKLQAEHATSSASRSRIVAALHQRASLTT